MAKRFLYMFAIVFILQMSWSVAIAYCMHESGKASQHFGHHQHKHEGENVASADDNTPPVKKATSHPDCASCSHGSLIIFAWSADSVQPGLSAHDALAPSRPHAAPYLGMPERPQWTFAA